MDCLFYKGEKSILAIIALISCPVILPSVSSIRAISFIASRLRSFDKIFCNACFDLSTSTSRTFDNFLKSRSSDGNISLSGKKFFYATLPLLIIMTLSSDFNKLRKLRLKAALNSNLNPPFSSLLVDIHAFFTR